MNGEGTRCVFSLRNGTARIYAVFTSDNFYTNIQLNPSESQIPTDTKTTTTPSFTTRNYKGIC